MSAEPHERPDLVTETTNDATTAIDQMTPLEIVSAMHAEDARVIAAVTQVLPDVARAVEAIAERLRRGGRLISIGAGTSGRLGALDAYECPATFNCPPDQVIGIIAGGSFDRVLGSDEAEDHADEGEADLARLSPTERDVVVGIAASGRTPYVLGALTSARRCGALTIGLACNQGTPLADLADVMIAPVVGPEVIAGSTRLKAGTAQKLILNMLSTGTMVLLGKTYGNMMVDVQITNQKLRQRALDIIQRIAEVDAPESERLLVEAGDEVKTAVIVSRTHLSPQSARDALAAHDQILRATLEALA